MLPLYIITTWREVFIITLQPVHHGPFQCIQRIPENRKLPILPVCMVLHMDMREYGSFLFSGFPCMGAMYIVYRK